ncbi:alpha/beta hydrolase [Cognataquiflexum aquatile]|uniref:alpha/beta hydrolase n=1 Tax=Cognataquiflexum aquatile TaxID=2249427 RepID=UPI000DE96789|nr:alpha/beta hydrolase-fold protein [Cognataquiflexum aquatile]
MQKYFPIILISLIFIGCKNEKEASRPSTAQSNVIVLEQSIEIADLNRDRQIRIYLPEDYWETERRYPVLYMHDGQNLFDDSTSYAGEWGVDEILNQHSISPSFEMIVVGIDNGQEKRMSELSPWENKEFGKAEGKEYMAFIVNQVKPLIDSTYRTLPERENTAIMGSSMGGLISHFAVYEYPEVFSKAGIFSPSYWYSEEVFEHVRENPIPKDSKLFLYVGKKEGEMVDGSQKMYKYILETGHPEENVILQISPEGEHNEASWGNQFAPAIKWLFTQ